MELVKTSCSRLRGIQLNLTSSVIRQQKSTYLWPYTSLIVLIRVSWLAFVFKFCWICIALFSLTVAILSILNYTINDERPNFTIPWESDDVFELDESILVQLNFFGPPSPHVSITTKEVEVSIVDDDSESSGALYSYLRS